MTSSDNPEKTTPPQPSAAVPPGFHSRELIELYVARRYDDLSEKFLVLLDYFEKSASVSWSPQQQHFVNGFIKHFLYLFTQPDYVISERYIRPFLRYNLTISNLVAVSSFRTTDAYLDLLRFQGDKFIAKTLTLYSARNSVKFDRRRFFDLDPTLASFWYSSFCQIYYSGLISEVVCRNLREHYEYRDERLMLTYAPQEAFFGSTYVDGECDRLIKPVVNRTFHHIAKQHRVHNTPDPRKIAILSGLWTPYHSVYRNYAHYVRALRGKYHLTFFQLDDFGMKVDDSMFDEVRQIGKTDGIFDLSSIIHNDFQLVYFPDVGMIPLSIILANMRLAPIQIASPGHSVSTWGAEIDYFMSGAKVEVPENPERNYSERLVLLPDCGVIHNRPLYGPRGGVKPASELVINCAAFSQKINFRFCRLLQSILDESQRPLRLRLFVGSSLEGQFNFLPFIRELESVLRGTQFEVIRNQPYQKYMALMEEGGISIDSFHFGGCNSIADSLFLRIPTVTYEGDKWYNRIGSQMLRMAGLPELIATNDDEYVRIVSRLIRDDSFRSQIRERLIATDLDATIFDASTADSFCDAVDYLIEHHDRLDHEPDRRALRFGVDIRGGPNSASR